MNMKRQNTPWLFCAMTTVATRAHAGFVKTVSPGQIAALSDVVATVEVVSVEPIEHSQAEIKSAQTDILVRRNWKNTRATVRVLRAFPADAFAPSEKTSLVNIEYSMRDMEMFHGKDGSFGSFDAAYAAVPILHPNDRVVLPLAKPVAPSLAWTLCPGDGVGLIVPALAAPLQNATPTTRLQFLENEIVNALVNGSTQRQPPPPRALFY